MSMENLNSKRRQVCVDPTLKHRSSSKGRRGKSGVNGEYEVTEELMQRNNNAAEHNKIEIGQMLCRNCATKIQSLPLPAPEPESEILECSDIDDEDASCMDV